MNEVIPDRRPIPEPDEISAFYWEGARQGVLLIQRCAACLRYQYPPDVVCVHCQSFELTPTAVSGRGVLYSYAIIDRPFHTGFTGAVPYVVALVELAEEVGLKVLTNLVGVPSGGLQVGMPVEVTFEDTGRVVLPQFRTSGESS